MKITTLRQYSDEFKKQAVQKSLDSRGTVKSVAESLGISPILLSKLRCQITSEVKASQPILNQGPE